MGLPSRMRAAVYRGPRKVEIEERPLPEIGPGDALVEVSHCGICGTDLHLVLEGMGRPGSIGGHEYSGRIVALGSEVEGFAVGDPVVGGQGVKCGECKPCRAGRPSLCTARSDFGSAGSKFHGAFADYTGMRKSELHRVPEGLDLRVAALTEPLAVALHALTVSGIAPGERALVTGAGPIGLLIIAALRARGIRDVVASEPGELRADLACVVGATAHKQPDALEVPPMPFTVVDDPVDVVFECSGNPRAMETGLAQLGRMGRLVIVGTGMKRPTLDHNRVLLNELVVTGAYNYDAGGFEEALSLLASGTLPTDHLIEPDDFPLEGLLGAIEQLGRGALGGKVMIRPKEDPR